MAAVIANSLSTAASKLTSRSVKSVRNAQKTRQWGGYIKVVDPEYKDVDPFIFLVHHEHSFEAGAVEGFSAHPHRGFETVTYVLDGGFDHADSRGNKGRYGAGDVQWLTTGSGVLHSEMFVTSKTTHSYFDGFQLWLNLPRKLKMTEPSYEMLWKKDIPIAKVPGGPGGDVEVVVIAGNVQGVKSKIEKSTPLSYLHVKLPPQTSFTYPTPKEHSAFFYVKEGSVNVGPAASKKKVDREQYALLDHDGDQFEVSNDGTTLAELLFFEGKPFKEPFAHRGPFVMNEEHEILEAHRDFRNGKFGNLESAWVQHSDDEDD